ncbi:LamG-like jellyroll fold domain-containing protein [Lignipirellula cremea]|uniref:Neutral/alkaline non-lysosomal ceramidase n=1 Tax=Lignipirellula cremea TaxID=2528010 RepID=A0A518E2V8_9BACT|nr:LamG-like jellyroll fold domain-containing protein [Lignipirellula cremea]QDU98414.1 Neutral/alkaline non-lysosomal ceramidase [Lignipirellula cremea]
MLRRLLNGILLLGALAPGLSTAADVFRAGAAAVDVTPPVFPVIVNGMFEERTADSAHDRLMSRALVLDDGALRIAIVVVDNLMLPRELLDRAKTMASESAGVPVDRILISATHTHSAPSAMGCLGSGPDPAYREFLPGQIAKSIVLAAQNLAPARVGWTVATDAVHNHCRRWIYRPDRMATDPFGQPNVRAHMHPGHQSANHIGPSGPADTDLSLLSVQTRDGRPLAVLANYAMHYYYSPLVSADFCGRFGDALAKQINASQDPAFVGIMSQGTSGDSMWMDYSQPRGERDLDAYTAAVATLAAAAYAKIEYQEQPTLAMAETTLTLRRRTPDAARLAAARETLAALAGKTPSSRPEIYAQEQIYLHEQPEVELKLQAIRIGDLGITGIPDEVYGLTGLKLKARSPLQPTFNIELANGAEGYIPPPEQHHLGGYTTWAARTAGLEVQAEPQIVDTLVRLLEQVSGRTARTPSEPTTAYAKAVLAAKPAAFWRLDEMQGSDAHDAVGEHPGKYELGVAFYLPGRTLPSATAADPAPVDRCIHTAGGRMLADVPDLGNRYSVAGWIWNGLPTDARETTGYCFARGSSAEQPLAGDLLGLGGGTDAAKQGKLIVSAGEKSLTGQTAVPRKRWTHVVLIRDGDQVRVYQNGQLDLEGQLPAGRLGSHLILGGRGDEQFGWEGKLDDWAVFARPLTAEDAAALYAAGGK